VATRISWPCNSRIIDRLSAKSTLSSARSSAMRGPRPGAILSGRPALGGRRFRHDARQPHGERAAAPQAVAPRLDRPAVHLDQVTGKRQPDAEPRLLALERRSACANISKITGSISARCRCRCR
jgi:hypothetical protein